MKNKALYFLLLPALLSNCARMELPPQLASTPESVSIKIPLFEGRKHSVKVLPWQIPPEILTTYPSLQNHREAFGLSSRLTDILSVPNRFEFMDKQFITTKQQTIDRLVSLAEQGIHQNKACQPSSISKNSRSELFLYPELYDFSIENQSDIKVIDLEVKKTIQVGIQLTLVDRNCHVIAKVSRKKAKQQTLQTDIFTQSKLAFNQTDFGQLIDATLKEAIAELIVQYDGKKLPLAPPIQLPPPPPEPLCCYTAKNRLALVIGNAHYQKEGRSLDNSLNDAVDMKTRLEKLGFKVYLEKDLTKQGMEKTFDNFYQRLKESESETIALFYYAGHAAEVHGGNYLFPIDVKINDEKEVDSEAILIDPIIEKIKSTGSTKNTNIIILDACRNNPYPNPSFNTGYNYLATTDIPDETLIAYSTSSNGIAIDGNGKRHNGLYTGELLSQMLIPVEINSLLDTVREEVKKFFRHQVPEKYHKLSKQFYFPFKK